MGHDWPTVSKSNRNGKPIMKITEFDNFHLGSRVHIKTYKYKV